MATETEPYLCPNCGTVVWVPADMRTTIATCAKCGRSHAAEDWRAYGMPAPEPDITPPTPDQPRPDAAEMSDREAIRDIIKRAIEQEIDSVTYGDRDGRRRSRFRAMASRAADRAANEIARMAGARETEARGE